jgi:hypothetical protein
MRGVCVKYCRSILTPTALIFAWVFFPTSAAHAGCILAINGWPILFNTTLYLMIVGYAAYYIRAYVRARHSPTQTSKTSLYKFHLFVLIAFLVADNLPSILPLGPLLDVYYPENWPDYSRAHDLRELEDRLSLDLAVIVSLSAIVYLFKKNLRRVATYMPLAFLLMLALYGGHIASIVEISYYRLYSPCCYKQDPKDLTTHTGHCPPTIYDFARCRECS